MAGTLTVNSSDLYLEGNKKTPTEIRLDWVSDSAGDVSVDIASTYAAALAVSHPRLRRPSNVNGSIFAFLTIPGENGDLATALPTNLHNITLEDPYGCDLAGSLLLNRSGTVAEKEHTSGIQIPVNSEITFKVSDAGDTKKGRIYIYLH